MGFNTARQPVTVVAGQTTSLPAQALGENATALGEAVVIGYGTQRRQDLTGAVEQIDTKQFVKGQVTNPEQLVQGKVAGVQITTGGGQPGAGTQILIRGGSSLSASNAPLIIIDGVPVDNTTIAGGSNALATINPNDIETITVLKDASATAIYGVRASNGVILVTTKRGVVGEQQHVTVSSLQSVGTVAKYSDILSADEFRNLVRSRGTTAQYNTLGTSNTNWQKEIYRNAYSADNNVSLSGAAGQLPYRVSVGYLYQEGLLKGNDLKRYTGALNLNPVLLNGNLRLNLSVKGSWIDNSFSNQGAVGAAVAYDPTQAVTSTDARYAPYGGYFQFLDPSGNGKINTLATLNPVALINQRRDRSTVKRSLGNLVVDYKIPYVTGLSANVNVGYDVQRGRGTVNTPVTDATTYLQFGSNNQYAQDLNNYLLEAYGKYEHDLGPGRLDLLGGYSYQRFEITGYSFNNNSANGVLFQQPTTPANVLTGQNFATQRNVLLSFYGRLNYNIGSKYLFTGTFRADNTSRFAPGKRVGYFPSGAFAWRIKGEDFLKNSTAVSELKLRLGYGQTGQQDFGGYYPYIGNFTQSNNTAAYQLGGAYLLTERPDAYNPNITWETTTTYNIGLDYGFADGRIYGSVDIYKRDTKNLLNFTRSAAGASVSNFGNFNVGSLTNKGIEVVTNFELVKSEKLNVTVNANATHNINEITKLTFSDSPNDVGIQTGGIAGGVGNTIQVNTVGYPAQSFYVQQQAYGANGLPLQNVFVDRNGDGNPNNDFYRYKSPRPTYTLGAGANINYRGVIAAFSLRANLGNYVYNNRRSTASFDQATSGFVNNTNREILVSNFSSQYGSSPFYSDYFLENASFLRMDNASLGYNFGELMKKGTNLSLSLAVQNVFVATKYKGVDPEVIGGIDNTIYPRPRTYTVGLTFGL
ncbi:MAG: SusC/RagA family TonB-linked outer membrane protein [Hymenobacter sp.]|nr:MAG: SusC/RagA family TonB-linked outer membrane protein [Hymenobacter sp.]